jgi:two-component system KDP operon response regulator KdpE
VARVTRVLIVEDDEPLLRALAMNLSARGYEVLSATNGTRALAVAANEHPDLILLDLGLPDLDGNDVIRGVRTYAATPIIVLSARAESTDKVTALDLGANDYVTKPFGIEELLARMRVATRQPTPAEHLGQVTIGTTRVDLAAKTAETAAGDRLHLTPTEWQLLQALVRRPGALVTREELLTELRGGPEHTDPSYLRIFVAQLRRKLEPDPAHPRHLLTEQGMGYRFQP